jgi:hypothetical protein
MQILDDEGNRVRRLFNQQALDDGNEQRVDVLVVQVLLQLRLDIGGLCGGWWSKKVSEGNE